jgi:hypothetical protein
MGWHCGFYRGSNPGEQRYGTAATFDQARAAFEAAWRDYLPSRTEADFEQWRQDAAYPAAKYSGWDRKGERWIQGTVYDFKSYRFVPSA